MSGPAHDVARAALPVAMGLLLLAAAARAALGAQVEDAEAKRLALQYLEPLSTWCLVATATYAFAVLAAGDAGAGALAVPLVLGVAAAALRSSGALAEPARAEQTAVPAPAVGERIDAMPVTASGGPLWAKPAEDEAGRPGLWSRT